MTIVATLAAAGAAGAALLVVHALYRGARRRIEVATLKPFDADSRPRLTLAPLTERALLLLRLGLVALALAIVLLAWPAPSRDGMSGDVVAVVPGTPVPSQDDAARRVWLDGEATPVSRPPRRDDVTGGALLALAQQVDGDDALTVSGALPAPAWPVEMPRFGRPVTFRGGALPEATAPGWTAADAPSRLRIVGDDDALAAAVATAVDTWRAAGLLPDGVAVARAANPDANPNDDPDPATISLGSGPPPARAWQARVVAGPGAGARDPDGVVAHDPGANDGVFATALWHALTRVAGRAPVGGLAVVPEPSGLALAPVAAGRVAGGVSEPVAPVWLWLLVVLFGLERVLAVRGAR